MNQRLRNLFPYIALGVLLAALAWAMSFGRLPPAELTLCTGDEVKSLDPAVTSTDIEGKIARGLFEGLTQWDPKTLEAIPGVAKSWDLSDDKLTYTFHLRDNALWSDGTHVIADDFVWSYRRFLHPGTAATYAEEFWYIEGSHAFTAGEVAVGDKVEVELRAKPDDGLDPLIGKLIKIDDGKPADRNDAKVVAAAKIFTVEIDGKERRFQRVKEPSHKVEQCEHVLPSFDSVHVRALDKQTLEIKLKQATPYFPLLTGFYPMYPVNRKCVQKYGSPDWVKPENIVTNGPFTLQLRRLRDRIRMVKNELYWDKQHIYLQSIDALPIKSSPTALNMYMTGQIDWVARVPAPVMPILLAEHRPDFDPQLMLGTYFYRLNVTPPDPKADPNKPQTQIRKALSNAKVRRALNMAIDKQAIVSGLLKSRDQPARSLVPPKMGEYYPLKSAMCEEFNPQKAQELLAEAGYPGGKGFPKLSIMFNIDENHQAIAEFIQSQWQQHLQIKVGLEQKEFQAMVSDVDLMKYDISRYGWFADYADPYTFIRMFITGGGDNQTGWSNKQYDDLLAKSRAETSTEKRAQYFHDAEQILMDELPIIPLYYYSSPEMSRTYIHGLYPNAQDLHPYTGMSIDHAEKAAVLAKESK